MLADLHIHTHYSDGSQSPEEVVQTAKKREVSMISICDHNSIKAYPRLKAACKNENIKLIQGVELDVYWESLTLHVLGYGFDPNNSSIVKLIDNQLKESDLFDVTLINNMSKDYSELSMEDYMAYTYPLEIGGWKNTNYIVSRGLAESPSQALSFFKQYATYKPKFALLADACKAIKEAGGIPVLAHPCNWWFDVPDSFILILNELYQCGIEGIECYYPANTDKMTAVCVDFCRKNDLRITCGGDGHGTFNQFVNGLEFDIGIMKIDLSKLDLRGIV